ncbi:MAG: NAD-dependent epimerase/dehydratase family protein [Nitrosopumilaceae archaeon]
MKIVITGGAGFIGSSVAQLLKKDHKVTIFDHKKPINGDYEFIQGNINDSKLVTDSIKDCDVVIHLAATLGVVYTEKNPIKTLDTNIIGTKNVLESCRLNNVRKIIFSSSSEVYGEPLKVPISEIDKPIPITNYGISKLAAEEYIKAYSRDYGFRYTILRLFNVYGDEQGTQWVVPEFVSRAIKNQDITIHNAGLQVRAFCYVSDVCDAFRIVLEKGDGEIFNIGNDKEPISIKELAKKIILLSNSKSTINSIPFEKSDRDRSEIMTRSPSIEKAKKLLGYNPKISLEEGILKMIKKKSES